MAATRRYPDRRVERGGTMKLPSHTLVVLVCTMVLAPAVPAPREASRTLQTDPRLEQRLRLPKDKPLPMAQIFLACAREAGVDLVAAGLGLRTRVALKQENPTARAVLQQLAGDLEGAWRVDGEGYVLGPPAGFQELAEMHPAHYRGFYAAQFRKVTGLLNKTEWETLRSGKPLEAGSMRPKLKTEALQIARWIYWRERRAAVRSVKLAWVEQDQFRLYLEPIVDVPDRYPVPPPGATRLLGVALYGDNPTDGAHYEYYFLR